MNITDGIGIGIVLVCVLAVFILGSGRSSVSYHLRHLPAFDVLLQAIQKAIEEGKQIHISLGRNGVMHAEGAVSLAALSALGRISGQISGCDYPPLVTSADGAVSLLMVDELKEESAKANAVEEILPEAAYLCGTGSFPYAAGLIQVMGQPVVCGSVLWGHYGIEAGLLTLPNWKGHNLIMSGSDDITGLALFYMQNEHVLLGEEMYALRAYLNSSHTNRVGGEQERKANAHLASLHVQDWLRWLLVISIVLGIIANCLGWI